MRVLKRNGDFESDGLSLVYWLPSRKNRIQSLVISLETLILAKLGSNSEKDERNGLLKKFSKSVENFLVVVRCPTRSLWSSLIRFSLFLDYLDVLLAIRLF